MHSGIYIIKNKLNNNRYLGSSGDIERRLSNHRGLLRRGRHHSYKLQGSWNKHGEENFEFTLFEEVFFTNQDKSYREELLECIEQYYLDILQCYKIGYNVSKFANRPNNEKCSENTKKSWITRREKVGGDVHYSKDHRAKISKSLRESPIFQAKILEIIFSRRKKVYQYYSKGEFVKEWESIYEILDSDSKFKLHGLNKVLNNGIKSYKGYIFSHRCKESVNPIQKRGATRKSRILIKKDSQGNVVEVFKSTKSMIDEGLATQSIWYCIGNGKEYKGYYYEYGRYN